MQTNVVQGLQVLRRTSTFLGKEINVPAKMGPISKHVAAFNAVVERLAELAAEQQARNRGFQFATRKSRDLARAIVREYVRPVIRSGKFLYPAGSPIRALLKLPKNGELPYEALIAAVDGVADQLEEHKATFIEAGFGDDFIEKVRGAVGELRAALQEKAEQFGLRAGATAGILREYARAREMVRMLDAMIAPQLEGTDRLAEWKVLSRFARVSREEEPGVTPTPGSTPVPVTPAVPATTSTPTVVTA